MSSREPVGRGARADRGRGSRVRVGSPGIDRQLQRHDRKGADVGRAEHARLQVPLQLGDQLILDHVNRKHHDFSTLDDFSPDALAYDTSGVVSTSVAFGCEGNVPGNGINCNGLGKYLPAPDYVEGTFDTVAPYCPSIPNGAAAGTKPLPQALVQLIVTDTTGAEDGPFRLGLTSPCKRVQPVKPAAKSKSTKHKARKTASKRR